MNFILPLANEKYYDLCKYIISLKKVETHQKPLKSRFINLLF